MFKKHNSKLSKLQQKKLQKGNKITARKVQNTDKTEEDEGSMCLLHLICMT